MVSAPAQRSSLTQSGGTNSPKAFTDNEILKQIVARDQAVRTATHLRKPGAGEETDEDRRKLVRGIIDRNELHTGADYRNAALVFQHSLSPDDYLLAHALAVIGASKGDPTALWLSAATLDRYLLSIKQMQIYGTQFSRKPPSPFEASPMNPGLLTDRLRQETGVPTRPEQVQQLQDLNSQAAKP